MREPPPNPPLYFGLALALQLLLHFFLPIAEWASRPWSLVGALPIAAGAALNLVADGEFKAKKTTVKPFLPSTALVTGGAFAWSRNPMYLGMDLILIGFAACLGTWAPLFVVPVFHLWIDARFIGPEERHLAEQFGESYREYARRVARWV